MMEIDLLEVAKWCAAILMVSFTALVVYGVFGAIHRSVKRNKK